MKHDLVIYFNEDFSENIPILERIYEKRFPDRLYIVPDHHSRYETNYRTHAVGYSKVNRRDRTFCRARRLLGRRNRHELRHARIESLVVRVTGFKYFFQDYFWQARKSLLMRNADWYWFVADDLLLNPAISADNMLDFLSVFDNSSKAVLCEPFYRRDEWVKKFQSDYEMTITQLRDAGFYAVDSEHRTLHGDPHHPGSNQWRIIAGCSDFFGCHRSILEQALKGFHALALKKIFVEIAVPNVLLSLDRHAHTTREYQWEFGATRGGLDQIREFLCTPHERAFYHPVKLGELPPDFVDKVIFGVV